MSSQNPQEVLERKAGIWTDQSAVLKRNQRTIREREKLKSPGDTASLAPLVNEQVKLLTQIRFAFEILHRLPRNASDVSSDRAKKSRALIARG